MNIETKNWKAQINRMPHDNFFRVDGVVTVPHSAILLSLEVSQIQDKSFDLRLDLKLTVPQDIGLDVLTDKSVAYKVSGASNVTGVSIFFEGKLLHHIDEILITH
ncbi:hypothetical protein [Pseudomonas sp. CCC3.1]|uniref:hypothetical protein n=1 Tax=Pseudomonas sp. CCC3.1 TaxID=3048607 RepID=UPI002AC9E9C9|nr:hypothetical protein [Pseudomonas sp. CCC3.1]MEB0206812.1 hypothetical protein [Pseudomonas sp. CCC3.1]WPX37566.1 hypothetical protein RHM56_05120 [Pseudomonas sp. CCC3.1]